MQVARSCSGGHKVSGHNLVGRHKVPVCAFHRLCEQVVSQRAACSTAGQHTAFGIRPWASWAPIMIWQHASDWLPLQAHPAPMLGEPRSETPNVIGCRGGAGSANGGSFLQLLSNAMTSSNPDRLAVALAFFACCL